MTVNGHFFSIAPQPRTVTLNGAATEAEYFDIVPVFYVVFFAQCEIASQIKFSYSRRILHQYQQKRTLIVSYVKKTIAAR